MTIYPLGVLGPWEIVIIALVILLLFGGKKIPELMRGLGKGVRSFKDGMSDVENRSTTSTMMPTNRQKLILSNKFWNSGRKWR